MIIFSFFNVWQVISRVGDLIGIKYFPAEAQKQEHEKDPHKVD